MKISEKEITQQNLWKPLKCKLKSPLNSGLFYYCVFPTFIAFQVYLYAIDSHFSDNFFTLLKGEGKEIEVSGNNFEKNNLVIWSLYNLNK